jgi:hypothetical protein
MENNTERREWVEALSDDALKANPSLHSFESVEDLAKSFVETKSMVGKMTRIPGEDAGLEAHQEFMGKYNAKSPFKAYFAPDATNDEAMALYHESIGIPKDIDGYKTPEVEGLNEEAASTAKRFAHELKMPVEMHDKFVKLLADESNSVQEATAQAIADNDAKLVAVFGPSKDQRINRIESLARGFDTPVEIGQLSPEIVMFLDKMADAVSGKGPQGFEIAAAEAGPDVSELKARVEERTSRMMKNPTMPRNEYNALQEANMRDREELIRAAQ